MPKLIEFQGDSITDAGRLQDSDGLGFGYARLVAMHFKDNHECRFKNAAVGGDTTFLTLKRLYRDTLAVKPDIVTVMLGVNDVWRRFDSNDVTTDREFLHNYTAILENIRDCGAKIIMLQPYIIRHGVVTTEWEDEYLAKKHICDSLAEQYAAAYVRTGDIFDECTRDDGEKRYSPDGVHPDSEGCKVIAEALIDALGKFV